MDAHRPVCPSIRTIIPHDVPREMLTNSAMYGPPSARRGTDVWASMGSRRMTARSQDGPLEIGEMFLGKYEVLELIGRGGGGHVYRVRHRFLGKIFALKAISKDGSVTEERVRRGQAEAQLLSSLRHPHVCEVFDADLLLERGLVYILMEYLDGRTYRQALLEHRSLRIEEALSLCAQIAEGTHAAHLAGAIHRDVKPDNLMICTGNQIKVLDFGVMKLLESAAWTTQRGIVNGTAAYMSPEQLHMLPIGPPCDVFALGLILYESLLGQHPIDLVDNRPNLTYGQMCAIMGNVAMPRIDDVDPRVPHDIARLIECAVHLDPEQRFASMKSFAGAMLECRANWLEYARTHGVETGERNLSQPSPNRIVRAADLHAHDTDHDTITESGPMFLGGISSSRLSPAAPRADGPVPASRPPARPQLARLPTAAPERPRTPPPSAAPRVPLAPSAPLARSESHLPRPAPIGSARALPARAPSTERPASPAGTPSTPGGVARRQRFAGLHVAEWRTLGLAVPLGVAIIATASAAYRLVTDRRAAAPTDDTSVSAVVPAPPAPSTAQPTPTGVPSPAPDPIAPPPPMTEPAPTTPAPPAPAVPAPTPVGLPAPGLGAPPRRAAAKSSASKPASDDFEEKLMRRAEEKLNAEEAKARKSGPAAADKHELWIR
jgi:serine/threonine-protein kinase